MFDLPDHYVWDFWLADDGERYHLYFLKAPRTLGDPDLRHWHARIGHAVSGDLAGWECRADPLSTHAGLFDSRAMWTGSVARVGDGWRMMHSGQSSAGDGDHQRIGGSTSADLTWFVRDTGADAVLEADPRWYDVTEPLHWRDPWLLAEGPGRWHLYITARVAGDGPGRGVVGHAVSTDARHWEVRPPLSVPGRFEQAEAISVVAVDGRWVLVFSCLGPEVVGAAPGAGGIWTVPVEGPGKPVDLSAAVRLTDERLYLGRLIQDRAGAWQLLAFRNAGPDGRFVGGIIDPVPVRWRADGRGLEPADAPAPAPRPIADPAAES